MSGRRVATTIATRRLRVPPAPVLRHREWDDPCLSVEQQALEDGGSPWRSGTLATAHMPLHVRTNRFLRSRARTEATSEPKRGRIGTQDVVTWAQRTCGACPSTMSMPAQRFLGHMMQLRSLKAKHYESGDGSIDPP